MKKLLLFIFCINTASFGQLSDDNYLIEYKKAVQLFANSQYEQASQKFTTLCSKNYKNPIVPYAYFYSALSSKNKGNLYQSRVIFRQLFENYFDFDKISEAKLIYADVNFSEGFYEEGLKSIESIIDPQFNTLKKQMLELYIPKITSLSNLKDLYFKFPTQSTLAQSLINKIQTNRFNSKDDLELSDLLTNRFKFSEEISTEDESVDPLKKTYSGNAKKAINVAVMLPFVLNETNDLNSSPTNRYTYDLYAGMKLAIKKLESDGVDLKLYAFDIQKSKSDFSKFEKPGNLKAMDLFVGPLYPDPNELASDFIYSNKIIQVHPISNNVSLLKDNRNIFLVQPSYTLQAKKSLDYMVSLNSNKSVSIFFGPSKKDSLFAYIYKEEAERKGYRINTIKKYMGGYQRLLSEPGHFFYTGDSNMGTKFLSLVSRNKMKTEVICTASSFNWETMEYSSLTENVSLIFPEYINKNKEEVKAFDEAYLLQNSILPSYFSYTGYDIILYFGRMLKEGKEIFKLNIEAGAYNSDYMLSGFDFSGKKYQNQIVPILKYNNSELEIVNR